MITYLGKKSLGLALPVLAQAVANLDIPGLVGQVAALTKLTVGFKPPSIAGTLLFAERLTAAASIAIVPPALSIKADLEAKLAFLKLKLELALALKDLLVQGSVRLYEFEGVAGSFGSEFSTVLAGPDEDGGVSPSTGIYTVVLITEGGTSGETTLRTLRKGA